MLSLPMIAAAILMLLWAYSRPTRQSARA